MSLLCHPVIDEYRGSFYLGSTTPDIRFFINAEREDTHFLALDANEGESGVRHIFKSHPHLGSDANLNDATRSFIVGYLSHLVTDEAWICRIYRPFFGESSLLHDDPMASLLDRLLQFELDCRERINSSSISIIRQAIVDSADAGVDIGFIDAQSLGKWREFVFISTTRKPNWEDFRRFAEKYLIWMRHVSSDGMADFFSSFDARLEQVLKIVPEAEIRRFREQAVADSVSVAREYLG